MSSINSILFPNGYNVSTIQKIDPQMNTAAGAPSGKLYQLGDRLPCEDRVNLKRQVAALGDSTLATLGPIRSNDVLSGNMTAEDAVMAVWQERYGKIRIDFETGQVYTSKDFSPVPKEGQLDAIREELRSSGMSDVLWSQYSSITTFSSTSISNYAPGDLAPALETLSASYAAQKHLLQEQFSGDELTEQLNFLEKSHQAHVDKVLDTYSEKVGGFLDRYGASGQTEKVRQSVQALMDEYIGKYEKILAENADPTGTSGTEDAWLGDHLGYLTQSLLQIGKGSGAEAKENGGIYTLRELEVINSTVAAYEQEITNARHSGASDEGRTALDLAMIDMKQETLERMSGTGKELRRLLESVRSNARDAVLDAKDEYFAKRREHTNPNGEKDSWFGPTDREMFAAVYQKVMATFHETGDALKAICDGADLAKPLLSAAAATDRESAMRWRSSTMPFGYWSTFYNDSSAYGTQSGGYQRYVNDWQSFLNTIPSLAGQ